MCKGMNRSLPGWPVPWPRVPRSRGDEPLYGVRSGEACACSPLARG